MRNKALGWIFVGSMLMVTVSTAQIQSSTQSLQLGASRRGQISSAYGNVPMTFEANQGQTDAQVQFVAHGKGYSAFLSAGGMLLSLRASTPVEPQQDSHTVNASAPSRSSKTALQFNLLGAAQNPTVVGEEQQPGRVNYFIGRDPKRWRTNVPTYARVRYKNVYPGIDLVYYGNPRQLEYDFEVSAASDPTLIQFEIKGANQLHLDPDGNLVLKTSGGELHFQSPVVYQESKGQRLAVEGGYVMKDATHIGFRVAQYDPSKRLVIDPTLVYSTYLGGAGDYNTGGIAVDGAGSIYVTGDTGTDDFPVTGTGVLGTFSAIGYYHAFIAKLDPSGSTLLYADYLGGDGDDRGYALTVNSANELYVTGATASSDFPLVNPFQATNYGSFTTFVTEISADGSSIVYSTYLGGNGSFDAPVGIALDSLGDILVAGTTSATNFPVANAFQSTAPPNQAGAYGVYGFLTDFAPDGASLIYSTYLSGSLVVPQSCGTSTCWPLGQSGITGLAVDANGNAYVTGGTDDSDFPITPGAYLATNSNQNGAGFVTKFNASGGLVYSTYLYGQNPIESSGVAIAVDSSGSAYVAGIDADNETFPITSTGICDPGIYGSACGFAYVAKLDPTGSSLLYATFLGPNNGTSPEVITLDASNNAYVLGYSLDCPSFNTVNAIESCAGTYNGVLVEIDPTGSTELFATYLGGSGEGTYSEGLALDSSGNIYVGGSTFSGDFPTTPGAYQTVQNGEDDPFLLKIAPDPAPAFSASPYLLQYSAQQVGSTSGATPIVLRNMGSSPLSISSIAVNGDFAETNDCGYEVPGAGSCTFSVTFAPTAAGTRSGSIVIKDNAAGSPHLISLIGNSPGGVLGLTPAAGLAFPGQAIGTSSIAKTVTVGNTGSTPLKIDRIQTSGDFAETNNCPTTMPAASSCTIYITFAPTALGIRGGSLTISDNVQLPQTLNLSGAGSDFVLKASTKSETIGAGETTTYDLTVASIGGAFSNAVKLTCSGLPAQTTCSFSPSAVTPGGSSAAAYLTLTTSAAVTAVRHPQVFNNGDLRAVWIPYCSLGLFGVMLPRRRRASKRWPLATLIGVMIVTLTFMTACAGGTGVVPQPRAGTPTGTYQITILGTSAALQHSVSLMLTVQ